MRNVKLRAWEKNLKEMIPVHNIDFQRKMINVDNTWRFFDEVVLMWHFGLKDKNDKEIYELDIVKIVNLDFPEDESIIDVVEWGLNCDDYYPAFDLRNFSYQVEMNSFSYIFNSGHYDIEVIGNVYENPDLLKKQIKL